MNQRDLVKIIARNVRAERLRAGLSQNALAGMTGLSVRYISRLETDPQNLRVDKIGLIAAAIGIRPEALLIRHDVGGSGEAEGETNAELATIAAALSDVIQRLKSIHARVG